MDGAIETGWTTHGPGPALARMLALAAVPVRPVLVLLVVLGVAGLTVWLVRTVLERPPASRRALRERLALFGDALRTAHDRDALARVILETLVEASGARGGRLLEAGRDLVRTGAQDGGEPVRIQLGDSGVSAVLVPQAGGFAADAVPLVEGLAPHAASALVNARLGEIARRDAVTDPLTGLANGRRLFQELEGEIARAERHGRALALMVIDVDDLSRVNAEHGHLAGDEVIRSLARLLLASVRRSDLPARLGGEELAVILPETELDGAVQVAETVRRAAADKLRAGAWRTASITVSIGVTCHQEGDDGATLVADATYAVRKAKHAGKNRVSALGPGAAARSVR